MKKQNKIRKIFVMTLVMTMMLGALTSIASAAEIGGTVGSAQMGQSEEPQISDPDWEEETGEVTEIGAIDDGEGHLVYYFVVNGHKFTTTCIAFYNQALNAFNNGNEVTVYYEVIGEDEEVKGVIERK